MTAMGLWSSRHNNRYPDPADTLQRCKASGLGHLSHGDPILDTAGPDSARMAVDVWLHNCEHGS